MVSVLFQLFRTRLMSPSSQRLVRELKIWAALKHANILRLIGFHLDESMTIAFLVSSYENNGHIGEYLKKAKPSYHIRLKLVSSETIPTPAWH